MLPLMAAGADVLRLGAVLGQLHYFGGVPAARRAIDGHGIVGLPLSLLGVLGAEAVQDVEYIAALLQGFDDIVLVLAALVHLGLVSVIHLNAESVDGSLEFLLEILGVGLLLGVEGVGHVRVGCPYIFLHVVTYLGHVDGNFPDPVVLVPGEEELRFLPLALQRLYHEEAGCDVPEIADVDGAGGADSGGAYILFLIRIPLNDFFRDFI